MLYGWKRIRCLQIVSQHVPIYLQQFPINSNRKCKKIAIFMYRSPHFCFPWRRPCDYHAICCMDGKTIQCLLNALQHVPIYLQQFPSYTMLKSMHMSKIRYFYHIFVSPGDAPGEITLNVVQMEREFDAYKLSRCMYPSNYYRFWDTARYFWKNFILWYPFAFDAPFRGVSVGISAPPLGEKTRMVSLPDGEKISKIGCTVWPQCTRVTTNQRPTTSRHSLSQ